VCTYYFKRLPARDKFEKYRNKTKLCLRGQLKNFKKFSPLKERENTINKNKTKTERGRKNKEQRARVINKIIQVNNDRHM